MVIMRARIYRRNQDELLKTVDYGPFSNGPNDKPMDELIPLYFKQATFEARKMGFDLREVQIEVEFNQAKPSASELLGLDTLGNI